MLEGDRFEILDITVRAGERAARQAFRELPQTGRADRRDRPRRQGRLPARRRHAAPGRPRDRLHRVEARPDRRASALIRARLGVDLAATFNLVGSLPQVSEPRAAGAGRGRRRATASRRAPFVAGDGDRLRVRPGSSSGSRTARRQVGMREGFLVVSLTWLFAAAVGALPYWLTADGQFSEPASTRYFEAMSGFTTTGATILTDVEGLSARSCHVAADDAVARRHGDHRARAGGAAPPARGRPAAARDRAAGPRDRGDDVADSRDGPAALAALHRTDRARWWRC